ncbi:TIGR04211 family SH3 domain-containing protein [Thalassotalea mangrovi]|uniref:TIGR04211 family SH3 domain-containing protein n=1 Tax=Thalassotalea mangrovi TaxID=2572245 RepID=A0A4U1BB07_9GAMM|nr:TIGR04211 family SH3 domain-containing protein [Thalassotalea mangrovi]TKB47188.1 TIGR04211 family SH3 domain-containing protein [Thalassotalea mangrovi]
MKSISKILLVSLLTLSGLSFAEEEAQQPQVKVTAGATGYVSDNLYVFFHSGAGNQYRILGSVNAGDPIEFIAGPVNDYVQIKDDKGRTGWIDQRFLSNKPGLRQTVGTLNAELADNKVENEDLQNKLDDARQQLGELNRNYKQLQSDHDKLSKEYAIAQKKIDNASMEVMKTYFLYGGGVLFAGLLFGLILPKLMPRKKTSW